jgi:hypothetical protein
MNWAIFSAPRHPLLKRVLLSIVNHVRGEYSSKSLIKLNHNDHRGKLLMCSSTFVITYVAHEMIYEVLRLNESIITNGTAQTKGDEQNKNNVAFRNMILDASSRIGIRGEHFQSKYKADMKAWYNDYLPDHWTRQVQKYKQPYLKKYANKKDINDYENMVVQGPGQLEVFLIFNGTRYGFPNFDTFAALGYDTDDVHDIPHDILLQVPLATESIQKTDTKFFAQEMKKNRQQQRRKGEIVWKSSDILYQ